MSSSFPHPVREHPRTSYNASCGRHVRASHDLLCQFRVRGMLASTVVATDTASVDADHDNGAALQHRACADLGKLRRKVLSHTRVKGTTEVAGTARSPGPIFQA